MNSGEQLQCERVHFRYGPRTVLEEVSLSLFPGQLAGLIGPNGSGKTTLLRVLSGNLLPAAGNIRLGERPLGESSLRERAQKIAVVPQENPFAFPFTVLEAILLGRYPHLGGLALEGEEDFRLVRAVIKRLHLEGFEERLVTDLSGGEKQRVVIARALAQQPQILLLDEPTSFLDLGQQLEIGELLRSLAREGLIVLAVFHDLNLASAVCDRLLLLDNGRLRAEGKPAEILTDRYLEEVFGARVQIQRDERSGLPFYLPVRRE